MRARSMVGGGPTFGEAVGVEPAHAMTSTQTTAAPAALITARRWIGSGRCATLGSYIIHANNSHPTATRTIATATMTGAPRTVTLMTPW